MTYFGVLAFGLVPPLAILVVAVLRQDVPGVRTHPWRPRAVLAVHVILALVYTTPWDNYLVAEGVWWYDPNRVAGITLGWVPIEEYLFFVLQTLLTGLWALWLLRRLPGPRQTFRPSLAIRAGLAALLLAVWGASVAVWFSGWPAGEYLTLILVWAVPPLLIQTGFGGDILLARARALFLAVSLPTLYLWGLDALAIDRGVWTINPERITGLGLGGLPVEEMLFFLMTNLLVACGVTLMASRPTARRMRSYRSALRARLRFAADPSTSDTLEVPGKPAS